MPRGILTDYFFNKEFSNYGILVTYPEKKRFVTGFQDVKIGTFGSRDHLLNIIHYSMTFEKAMLKHRKVAIKCRT